jgi:hypothetical protein
LACTNYFFGNIRTEFIWIITWCMKHLWSRNGRRIRRTSCSGYLKQNLLYFQNGKSSENSWKTLTGRCISHQYNATKHSNRLLWNRWKNHESPCRYYGGIQMSGIWPTGTAALWRNEWVKFLDLSSSTILL